VQQGLFYKSTEHINYNVKEMYAYVCFVFNETISDKSSGFIKLPVLNVPSHPHWSHDYLDRSLVDSITDVQSLLWESQKEYSNTLENSFSFAP
jgi:hypothetical protein